jgi:hypothetical protein
VECPACQGRLSLLPGHTGTFKASCAQDRCGAELLCEVEPKGQLTVKGPGFLHEEEGRRELAVRGNRQARSFWAPGAAIVIVLGAFGIYVLPIAFAVGGGVGIVALGGLLAIAVAVMTVLWLRARISIKPAEPLRVAERALVVWEPPAGYRG